MTSTATTPEQYLLELPEDRQFIINTLRNTIIENLPAGFQEVMQYGMLSYVVPHSIYPAGYHCDTKLPLPFLSLASQKNHIAIYHMGIYADENLLEWFKEAWANASSKKLDMGKSCIKFKKAEDIPIELIASLVQKLTPQAWIELYEKSFRK